MAKIIIVGAASQGTTGAVKAILSLGRNERNIMKTLIFILLCCVSMSYGQVHDMKKTKTGWETVGSYNADVYVTISDTKIFAQIGAYNMYETKVLTIMNSYYKDGYMIYKCKDDRGVDLTVKKKDKTMIAVYKNWGYRAYNCNIKRV